MPELYAWQRNAKKKFLDKKKGVIQAVTGSGKTILAVDIVLEVNAPVTHIVVPRVGLIDQWAEEFRSMGYVKPLGKFGGKHGAENEWRDINIWTIDTARKYINHEHQPGSMLVVDECHRSTSPTRRQIYKMKPDWCLAVSASAFDGGTYLVNLVGGGLCFNYDFEDALADGVVSDYEINSVSFDLTDDNQEIYDATTEEIKLARRIIKSNWNAPQNYSLWPSWVAEMAATTEDPIFRRLQMLWLERKRVVWQDPARLMISLDLIDEHKGERIVIFHQQIEECDKLGILLKERGVSCGIEHSGRPMRERKATVEGFRKGKFDVLITCRTLDEGFNVPNISVGIIAASSSTSTQMIQRVGRVIRKAARKGKALIYRICAARTVDTFAIDNLMATGAVHGKRIRYHHYNEAVINEIRDEHRAAYTALHYTTIRITSGGQVSHVDIDGDRIQLVGNAITPLQDMLQTHAPKGNDFRLLSNNTMLMWKNKWVKIGECPTRFIDDVPNVDWLVYTPFEEEVEFDSALLIFPDDSWMYWGDE